MNNNDAIECVNRELKKYNDDLLTNIQSEIIGSGIYFGSSFSIAYLVSLLSDRISLSQTAIPAFIIPIIITIKNHSVYARSNDVKESVKILKGLKKEIEKGYNPFEEVDKNDFSKVLTQKFNYKNTLI